MATTKQAEQDAQSLMSILQSVDCHIRAAMLTNKNLQDLTKVGSSEWLYHESIDSDLIIAIDKLGF